MNIIACRGDKSKAKRPGRYEQQQYRVSKQAMRPALTIGMWVQRRYCSSQHQKMGKNIVRSEQKETRRKHRTQQRTDCDGVRFKNERPKREERWPSTGAGRQVTTKEERDGKKRHLTGLPDSKSWNWGRRNNGLTIIDAIALRSLASKLLTCRNESDEGEGEHHQSERRMKTQIKQSRARKSKQ